LFRTVATTLVLVGFAARLASRSQTELTGGDVGPFAIIGTVYLLTLVTGLLLRTGRAGRRAAWTQIGFDVTMSTLVVLLTGGQSSPFAFLFLLAIIGAALVLGERGALVGFLSSTAAQGLVVVLALQSPAAAVNRVLVDAFIQVLAQILIAVLSGYVGEQLATAGGRLAASEKDLEKLTALQNEIVRAMPSGLVTCDAAGLVTFMNAAAAGILGLPGTPEGTALERLLPGVGGLRGQPRAELRVDTPRGARVLGLSVTPLSQGEGLLIVFQDLTELRRIERELASIDHLATLGRMSAQLAHEIRNPLAAMRGAAQMLATDAVGTPSERLARLVVRESDRLAELVEGYLKLARPPPPARAPVRLDQVARETVELLRADPGLAGLVVEERLEPVEADADPAQVKQVLLNLIRNAARAVESTRGRVRVRVAEVGGRPLLEVWDSAGALAPEDRARVFEPFFSRSSGSGLGLSTVHSIVQAHGGTISVESDPASGTTFAVTLPRKEVAADGAHSHR
jgi:two-component system sensor histidine kinase PilS (NtrC family)